MTRMIQIKNYEDSNVEIINATNNPVDIINKISNICMQKDYDNEKVINKALIHKLLYMNHTSVFEHVIYTFYISGISRNCATQIIRHRIASYMSNSQHYQNYSKYNFIGQEFNEQLLNNIMDYYNNQISLGVPIYEARQILPGGMETNLIMTINARSLINFLNQRLCNRNVPEMIEIAEKIHVKVKEHFPELFEYVNCDCIMNNECNQGKMRCKNGFK
jgi:thymidylate synthase (FAD)